MASSSTTSTKRTHSTASTDDVAATSSLQIDDAASEESDALGDFERERLFGISEFSDARASRRAFDGILKHLFSDFVVNEVDRASGAPVQLSDRLSVPPRPALPVEAKPTDDDWRRLGLADADIAALTAFVAAADKSASFDFPPALAATKESRTALHLMVKRLQLPLVGRTLDSPTRISLAWVGADASLLASNVRGGDRRVQSRGGATLRSDRDPWPVRDQRFLSFVLCKQNVDTQSALIVLARALHVPIGTFAVAGAKDKRAVTTQRVTAFKMLAERLVGVAPRLANTMLFGDYRYVGENMQLGEHGANQFGIVLRELTDVDDAVVADACEALRAHGFLNYFGLQRFGSAEAGAATPDVGRCLLRRDYRAAVLAIMAERSFDTPDVAAARRRFLESGDAAGALAAMPDNNAYHTERLLLAALVKRPNDYMNALNSVPRNLRLMYLHAWQSLVFNQALTERVRRHGYAPCAGDLVWLDAAAGTARHLTADDIAANTHTLSDILLPVIGHATLLPANDIADVYRTAIGNDRLDMSSFEANFHAAYDLAGVYRTVVARPAHFEWRIARYSDASVPLIRTPFHPADAPLGDDPAGAHRALVLSFHLQPSTYATMLYRELTRSASGKEAQRAKSRKLH
jgi:tRNA pseudouridine13 synthase